jgi:hypothetical protein
LFDALKHSIRQCTGSFTTFHIPRDSIDQIMFLKWELLRWLSCVLAFSTVLLAQTKPADDGRIADFEAGHSFTINVKGAKATTSGDGAAQGQTYLRISPSQEHASIRLGVPKSSSFVGREQLSASVRTSQPVNVTWMALDERHQPIFLSISKLEGGNAWRKIDFPLRAWRWPGGRAGDWDEVTDIGIAIDGKDIDHVDVDDIRLEQAAPAEERTTWLLDLAFEQRALKRADRDGFLVATDAIDAFTDADLQRLLNEIAQARKFIHRTFADAVRPIEQISSPPMLLIFSSEELRSAFLSRLGDAWSAKINVSGAQGFTVHDIATTTYVQKLGVRRPVYLHEAVHAIVSRDLRLLPGHDVQGMLQEAIANYLQLCVYPTAIAPEIYPKAFVQPIDGKGIFKPLESLLQRKVSSNDYAQLASLMAYLVEKDQPLLRDLVSGVADGQTVSDVLARRGPTFGKLQDAWLEWGRARFKSSPAAGAPIFEQPVEFR